MCQQESLSLPADARSPARARDFVGDWCRRLNFGELCDDIILPVSELVTNAFLHGGTTATLTVSLTGRFVEVAVSDGNPRQPVLRPVRNDVLSDIDEVASRVSFLPHDLRDEVLRVGEAGAVTAGRGLLIVDAVADEWGLSELASGKAVWFRVTTPTQSPGTVGCPCPDSTSTTVGGAPFSDRAAS